LAVAVLGGKVSSIQNSAYIEERKEIGFERKRKRNEEKK
jgi:hypothetical protein